MSCYVRPLYHTRVEAALASVSGRSIFRISSAATFLYRHGVQVMLEVNHIKPWIYHRSHQDFTKMPHTESIDEEDLSYEDMKCLLQDAATRLQERANGVQELSKFEVKATKLPSLNAGKLPTSYVTKQGDIASVNMKALPLNEQRSLADAPRKIVDPVVERRRKEEV